MTDQPPTFQTSVKRLADGARRQTTPPSLEELVAYVEGELTPSQEDRLRDRLALFPESSQAVLDLVEVLRVSGGDETTGPSGPHVPTWSELSARLAEEETAASRDAEAPARTRIRPFWARSIVPWAAAAGLLMLIGFWFLPQRPAAPADPQKNVRWYHLQSDAAGPTRADRWQEVKVSTEASHFGFILNLGDAGAFADYSVEISKLTESGAETVWQANGFRPGSLGTFDLLVPTGFLPVGRYQIRLRGLAAEGHQPLARYEVELVSE